MADHRGGDWLSRFLVVMYTWMALVMLLAIPMYEHYLAAHLVALIITVVGASLTFVGAALELRALLTSASEMAPLADMVLFTGILGTNTGQIIYSVQTHRTVFWFNILLVMIALLTLFGPGSGGKRRQAAKLLGEKSRALRDKLTSSAPAPKTGDATP